MAENRLSLSVIPQATRYNQLTLWLLVGVGILFLVVFLVVMNSRGRGAQWEERVNMTSRRANLVEAEPVVVPPPPPPPQPIQPEQQMPPPPPQPAPRPQPAAQPDPDIARRKAALLKAMSAKVIVEGFSPEGAQAANVATGTPQQDYRSPTREMARGPEQQQWPYDPRRQMMGWKGGQQPALVGRNQQFWGQSSNATTSQHLAANVLPPRSPYQVTAGTIIPAVLAQAINSDLEGTVTALVSNDVYDSVTGRYLLIPQGSRLFGVYDSDLQANQPRLHLAFKTLYFPNGYSISLEGMPGTDQRGIAGLSDQVNRHFFQRYGTAAVLSLITAGISMATYGGGYSYYSYEPQDAAMRGAGQVLGRAVEEDLRRAMSIRPTVTVREAYPFNMTIVQDVTFPGPYPFTQGGTE